MAESLSWEAGANDISKQQQTLPGKLASVFEKDFTIDVLLHKKLRKTKIKTSKSKKIYNADAGADVNADADAEMPMPRFPNGPLITLLRWVFMLRVFKAKILRKKQCR